MGPLRILVQIAVRNLFTSTINLVIGGIILVGTALVVVGGAMLDSIDGAMTRSLIGSGTGDLQIYSSQSTEDLDLSADQRLPVIDGFPRIKQELLARPEVLSIVPTNVSNGLVLSGNAMDDVFERLRNAVRAQAPAEQVSSLKRLAQQMVRVLQEDLRNAQAAATNASDDGELAALDRAASDAFWAEFDQAPLDALEFLENRIAKLVLDAETIKIRYIGTDLEAFQAAFDRMHLKEGTQVPPGKRGLLMGQYFYEDKFKLKTARRLDLIHEALTVKGRRIAEDPELRRYVARNQKQVREILFQLDDLKTQELVSRLQRRLSVREPEPAKLLALLLNTSDENFLERYQLFYSEVAPLLALYRIQIGDVVTVQNVSPRGYVQSVNVPFYGTIEFKGLEKSPLAGTVNLMDLISFQKLQGAQSQEEAREIEHIKSQSGLKDVDRSSAEDALFGSNSDIVGSAEQAHIDEESVLEGREPGENKSLKETYTQEELDQSVVLSAAVLLKPGNSLESVAPALEDLAQNKGLPIKLSTWKQASGLIGQFTLVVKAALYFGVFMIFVVALIVINNAMMMAALQRVREIGTMRAIGAQRGFVRWMIILETLFLGITFGSMGALASVLLMGYLGNTGLPAVTDEMHFFFSGPRLFPSISVANLLAGYVMVLGVSVLSTLYPAILATRVSPVQAMQAAD
ncbi:ABC transporter permease [Stigmatella aurantiaca]|uniref:ABC transporter, permease protein n=1 Tax=Stigmatella aurantiaca (strain DW4/3-1) TaxID=378806 RepID=Q08PP0_STIAD|nr:FtsX-like permease family protein [Stigmatella aurantiaca]ADO71935.1 ABC transporter, permease protein [Stigmatella aurantiaca DW4/3-1]EAU62448.1 efflux ABC transporter, permease protein [Stigmatella aurantiaca DW4/3-1]